ncbi:hypothetical protein [Streptomyces glaucus]|uniref:Ribosome modulation factor n=1 Tax=Streptomyces glaucus TaxID=284029 RepID=A0ABN3JWQ0_9ACTN
MELNRETYLALVKEGKAAYANGDPSDACPYSQLGDKEQRVAYYAWTEGWGMARSEAEAHPQEPEPSAGH